MFRRKLNFLFFRVSVSEHHMEIHKGANYHYTVAWKYLKKDGKDQETIQSSTTPDPGYHMGK